MASGIKCGLPLMNQLVVSLARANNQIAVAVVEPAFVNVMNNRPFWQRLPKSGLGHQHVTKLLFPINKHSVVAAYTYRSITLLALLFISEQWIPVPLPL